MANTIVLKRNSTNSNSPTPEQLILGEPVVNTVSGRFFIKDSDSVVVDVGSSVVDVTVINNKFYFNGSVPGSLLLQKGQIYIFKQTDSSNSGNTLYLSTNSARNYPTNSYTTGVEFQSEALVWKVPYNTPEILYINSQQNDNYVIPIIFGTQFSHKLPFSKTDGSSDSMDLQIGSHRLPFTTHSGTSDPLDLSAVSVTPDFTYTKSEVDTRLAEKLSISGGTVSGSIIPSNSTVDLGSSSNPFRDLYITEGTLHFGNTALSTEDREDGTKTLKVGSEEVATLEYRSGGKKGFKGQDNLQVDELAIARTIEISGSILGSVEFDGSKNVNINTTVNHNHNDLYDTSAEVDAKVDAGGGISKGKAIAMAIVFG